MKIAYISFEFPPDTAIGGIATYTMHAAQLMAARGHQVEVFTSSPNRKSLSENFNGHILVHRVQTTDRDNFSKLVLPIFSKRHEQVKFDIAESPEYSYEGMEIKKAFPSLPMIVRFHTPGFWVKHLNKTLAGVRFKDKIKKLLVIKQYKKEKDKEYLFSMIADGWIVPCTSMKDILVEYWGLDAGKIAIIPNPFQPPQALLEIDPSSNQKQVIYTGRLEVRKGVTQLAAAIPIVLSKDPAVKFCFVGKPNHAPGRKGMMDDYLKEELKQYKDNIEFIPHVSPDRIPSLLAQYAICVFPSYWELFGYVCTEAMAAARGIVAGREGGMKDMLEDVNAGILIDPKSPEEIAAGILFLINDPVERSAMGKRGREKVVNYYAKAVPDEMERYYIQKKEL